MNQPLAFEPIPLEFFEDKFLLRFKSPAQLTLTRELRLGKVVEVQEFQFRADKKTWTFVRVLRNGRVDRGLANYAGPLQFEFRKWAVKHPRLFATVAAVARMV